MTIVKLSGGPMDGKLVSPSVFRDGYATLRYVERQPIAAWGTPPPVSTEIKTAIYRITDQENLVAEISSPPKPNEALLRAMENASDEEILELLTKASELKARKK